MKIHAIAAAIALLAPAPLTAATQSHLECVPYARQVTGIQIYGDAHTWWAQAEGRYARGSHPRIGAVMSFRPFASSRLGHVAAVSRIVDHRTVLVRHSNWSPIDGMRGQIEDNVRVVDVSDANDWSEVRVWYAPNQALGTTRWPLNGFIYNDRPASNPTRIDRADRPSRLPLPGALRTASSSPSAERDPIGAIIARAGLNRR